MIIMKHGTRDGTYHLKFKVYDRKHTQTDVPANVTVTVKEIPHGGRNQFWLCANRRHHRRRVYKNMGLPFPKLVKEHGRKVQR